MRYCKSLALAACLVCAAGIAAGDPGRHAAAPAPAATGCCGAGTAPASTPAGAVPAWANAVRLTAAQKRRIQGLEAQQRACTFALARKVREVKSELVRLQYAEKPRMDRIKAATQRLATYKAQMEAAPIEARVRRGKVLTPAQRAAVAKWEAAVREACTCGSGSGCGACGSASVAGAPAPRRQASRRK